ncbi:MAG TPA: hypothetical protein VFL62_02225, partial [Bradyrhizobium sp.]|nr:hypothetical protein [Bradyrhizobium sp.]
MPQVSSWLPHSLLTSLAVISVLASSAVAQQPPTTTRIRGTIESVDGKTLSIKTREGNDVKVNITDDITVIGIAKSSLSDIKSNSYIGVSGMPQPDGSQKAIAIHIFPEAMRGAS